MIVNNIEIKPGYVFVGTPKNKRIKRNVTVVTFPTKNGIGFVCLDDKGWSSSYETFIKDLICIKDASDNGFVDGGEILWEKLNNSELLF